MVAQWASLVAAGKGAREAQGGLIPLDMKAMQDSSALMGLGLENLGSMNLFGLVVEMASMEWSPDDSWILAELLQSEPLKGSSVAERGAVEFLQLLRRIASNWRHILSTYRTNLGLSTCVLAAKGCAQQVRACAMCQADAAISSHFIRLNESSACPASMSMSKQAVYTSPTDYHAARAREDVSKLLDFVQLTEQNADLLRASNDLKAQIDMLLAGGALGDKGSNSTNHEYPPLTRPGSCLCCPQSTEWRQLVASGASYGLCDHFGRAHQSHPTMRTIAPALHACTAHVVRASSWCAGVRR